MASLDASLAHPYKRAKAIIRQGECVMFGKALFGLAVFATLSILDVSAVRAQPAGSYQKSCSAVIFQGDSLSAFCRDRHGASRRVRIDYVSACVGDIFNDDGALRCSRSALPPPGSYTKTCEMQYVGGGYLNAKCRNRDGNRVRTTLSGYGGCAGDIYNDNGNLSCAQVPSGSYLQTCDSTHVVGETLVSRCKERGGLYRQSPSLPEFRRCVGDIFNDNGILGCRR
jgi:hypothetical protein